MPGVPGPDAKGEGINLEEEVEEDEDVEQPDVDI